MFLEKPAVEDLAIEQFVVPGDEIKEAEQLENAAKAAASKAAE
jgi:hypothetical protein